MDVANKMVNQVKQRSVQGLTDMLLLHQLLSSVDHADAPHKIDWENFLAMCGRYCLCIAHENRVQCTCFLFAWRGACPHGLATEQLPGIKTWHVPLPIPDELLVPAKSRRR